MRMVLSNRNYVGGFNCVRLSFSLSVCVYVCVLVYFSVCVC